MAYTIVERLRKAKFKNVVVKLQKDVKAKDKMRGKIHEIWTESFDIKECRTEKFILQKLIYIHCNPCSGKWQLASDPLHYPHRSALFYISGKPGIYEVRDYREFRHGDESLPAIEAIT